MGCKNRDEYIEQVLAHVRYKRDHKIIYDELMAHFEDKTEALTAIEDQEEHCVNKFERKLIDSMGDGRMLGKALNKEHNFIVGWIFFFSRIAFFVTIFWCILGWSGVLSNLNSPSAAEIEKEIREKYTVTKTIEVNKVFEFDGQIISFDKVILHEPGHAATVFMAVKSTNILLESSWSLGACFPTLLDKDGNEVSYDSGTGRGSSGYIKKEKSVEIQGIPSSAEYMVLDYSFYDREIKVTVPLKEGVRIE